MIAILSLSLLAVTGALPNRIDQRTVEKIEIKIDQYFNPRAPIVKLECPAGYAAVGVGGECIDRTRNVITVPNNCPEGQVWVNGKCRDIWRFSDKVKPKATIECPVGYSLVAGECIDWLRNVVTVPNNCPEGQVWVNGACRDIWRSSENVRPKVTLECPDGYSLVAGECIDWLRNVVTVPNNCPEGQVWVNGACRDIWRSSENLRPKVTLECPVGYSLVAGECIDWLRNVVTVPNNCPEGQVWINGACRDIWRSSENVRPKVTLECPVGYSLVAGECIDWLRNVVTVPNNCPEGQAWVNGACRDIWRNYDVNVQLVEHLSTKN